MKTKQFIIDTDLGSDIDDALAIIIAIVQRSSSVAGIITTGGQVHCRTARTIQLLEILRCDIPIFQGREKSLSDKKPFSIGTECNNIPSKLLDLKFSTHEDLWKHVIKTGIDVKVICLAPLTNLADIIIKIPKIKKQIKEVIIMGSVFDNQLFDKQSNFGELSEHNLGSDPKAINIILDSGLNITLVPLNITFKTELKRADLESSLKKQDLLRKSILSWTREWLDFTNKLPHSSIFQNRIFLHDPLTVAIGMNLINHKFVRMPISINKDGLAKKTISGIQVKVCINADIERLKLLQLNSLYKANSKIQ